MATTHLKARTGALLSTLRNEQGKDIQEFIQSSFDADGAGGKRPVPVIVTGDFNAEPTEPVYETMTSKNSKLRCERQIRI